MDTTGNLAQLLVLGATAALSVGAGWLFGRARERKRLAARKAYEAEMERSTALGRERARAAQEEAAVRLTRLQQEHAGCAARMNALSSELTERDDALSRLAVELAECRQARDDATRLAERLQVRMDEHPEPEWVSADGDGDGELDDLRSIRGLGPVLEQRLHELGIHRFHQLARMDEEGVHWLASRLRILPGRIRREQWAEQAREQARKRDKHT